MLRFASKLISLEFDFFLLISAACQTPRGGFERQNWWVVSWYFLNGLGNASCFIFDQKKRETAWFNQQFQLRPVIYTRKMNAVALDQNPVIWSSGHPEIWPFVHPVHPVNRPSGRPVIRPFKYLAIQPSGCPPIRPSGRPAVWPPLILG